MKTKYKFIYFKQVENPGRKTQRWECYNSNSEHCVGEVVWYSPWRRYWFYVAEGTGVDMRCCLDIADFLKQLMDARKK